MNKEYILIVGGTGFYGQYITEKLIKKYQPVRVLTRNKIQAKELLGDKPEYLEGDIQSEDTIKQALNNVSRIIISISAFDAKNIKNISQIENDAVLRLLNEAEKRNIKRIVYLSVYKEPPPPSKK